MLKAALSTTLLLFILLSIPLDSSSANLNKYCQCSDITPVKLWDSDAWLWLSRKDKDIALHKHLPWGVPESPEGADHEKLLIQTDYILSHDGDLRTSTWAAYLLKKRDVEVERSRQECFRKDVRVKKSHAGLCVDYLEATYDQGHLVPNSDMKRTLRSMINTYMMSNMAPQHCNFNRGSWLVLEGLARHWAKENNKIYVITGAVFDRDGVGGRDADSEALRMISNNGDERVAVASHFYKILIHKQSDRSLKTLSILLPHHNEKLPSDSQEKEDFYINHIVSIDEIEQITGVNFLPDYEETNPAHAEEIKRSKAEGLWTLPDRWPNRLDQNCN